MPAEPTDSNSGLQQALVDRYRIERELGSGGMATVYLAEDVRHHRSVALKVLRPDLGAAVAISTNIGGDMVLGVGFLAGGAAFIAQYVAFRTWYHRFIRKRSRVLSGLAERISGLIAGSGNLALPADDAGTRIDG